MQKIKNWSKIESAQHSYAWENIISENKVTIISPYDKDAWFIEIGGEYGYIIKKETKQEALSYTYDYMKNHPEG